MLDLPRRKLAVSRERFQRLVDKRCSDEPLYWLQHYTATENPKYEEQGREFIAPFPMKSYFVPLFKAFSESRRLFIPKTREMLTSWAVMGWATNRAQWHKWDCLVQTEANDKAVELVDYAAQLYRHQPEWLKARHKLTRSDPAATEIVWEGGGRVMALPKGANKMRLYHPTLYVMDEAAFLPEAEECYNVAHPVAQQIIAISSAGPGWFGNQCSR